MNTTTFNATTTTTYKNNNNNDNKGFIKSFDNGLYLTHLF